jgi:hypothetical protein
MAEEIAYKVSVDTGQGGKSLKDLKNDFKQAQAELSGLATGTKEYVKQLEKLGAIRDNIGDLNAEINAFNPEGKVKAFGNVVGGLASGFQAATGAAALFGGESKDVEKALLKVQAVMAFTEGIKGIAGLSDGFKVLGNVIKANPLMLIGTIIIGIGTALFALKDKVAIVGQAFDAIGSVITYVMDKIKAFTDAIGISNFAMDKLNDSIIANSKRAQAASTSMYDSKISELKREHKETVFVEIEKQKAILATNKLAIEAIGRQRAANGTLTEEQLKQITELQKANSEAYKTINDSWATYKDKEIAKDNEAYKNYKTNLDKKAQDLKDYNKRADEINAEADAKDAADQQAKLDAIVLAEEKADIQAVEIASAKEQARTDKKNKEKEDSDARIALNKAEFDATMQTAEASTKATADLANFIFDLRNSHLVKGSAAQLKAAKRQFQVNKALAISSNIISTIVGVTNALGAQSVIPEPFGTILKVATAAAVGISGTIATAKIASQKFDGGGSSGGGGGGSIGVPSISAPTIAPPSQGSTQLNPDGSIKTPTATKQPIIKAVVVETDITKSQDRVSSIEKSAIL